MLTLYNLHAIDSIYRQFVERKKEKNKKEETGLLFRIRSIAIPRAIDPRGFLKSCLRKLRLLTCGHVAVVGGWARVKDALAHTPSR